MDLSVSMLKGRGMRIFIYWLVVILVVVIDQATKAAAIEVLEDGPKTFVAGLIDFIHVENTGAAFSIGEGGNVFFILVAIVFIATSTYFVWKEEDLPYSIAVSVGAVAGGGLGNMIDRIMNGSVTDFIALRFIDFPIFNVADMFVTCGIVFTVVAYWRWEANREREEDRFLDAFSNDGSDNA